MPFINVPTRRLFLGAAVASLASLRAAASSTRWALLSDTHVAADPADENRGFRPTENLQQVVTQVRGAGVAGSLINGDLARLDGQAADYAHVQTLLEPLTAASPLALTLGNHDDRDHFLQAFTEHRGETQDVRGKYVLVVEDGPVRFILLDSLFIVNMSPGLLGQAQRRWLESYLAAASDMPTVVFVHHTLNDSDGALLDADRMLRILSAHPMVKAVFYGHSHVYNYDMLDGMHLINQPAVGYNFADNQPVGWLEATFHADGAELTLHAIGGNIAEDGVTKSISWRG